MAHHVVCMEHRLMYKALGDAHSLLQETAQGDGLQHLDTHQLQAHVQRYRDSISQVSACLAALGAAPLATPHHLSHLRPPTCAHPSAQPDETLPLPQAATPLTSSRQLHAHDGGIGGIVGQAAAAASDREPSPTDQQDEGVAIPPHSEPIQADVRSFDWPSLYCSRQFDVIMMDPPWQLASANPTRGVALGYSQLSDADIASLPIPALQRDGGFLFVWVINCKYALTLALFDHWGYKLVDEVVWVKTTVNGRLAKSHGYYLQHAKEVCLVGRRKVGGRRPPFKAAKGGVGSDVIVAERRGQLSIQPTCTSCRGCQRGKRWCRCCLKLSKHPHTQQSQKPEEIYHLVEQLVPGGRYLEIFARRNNLRDHWVSIGNEVLPHLAPPRAPPQAPLRPLSRASGGAGAAPAPAGAAAEDQPPAAAQLHASGAHPQAVQPDPEALLQLGTEARQLDVDSAVLQQDPGAQVVRSPGTTVVVAMVAGTDGSAVHGDGTAHAGPGLTGPDTAGPAATAAGAGRDVGGEDVQKAEAETAGWQVAVPGGDET